MNKSLIAVVVTLITLFCVIAIGVGVYFFFSHQHEEPSPEPGPLPPNAEFPFYHELRYFDFDLGHEVDPVDFHFVNVDLGLIVDSSGTGYIYDRHDGNRVIQPVNPQARLGCIGRDHRSEYWYCPRFGAFDEPAHPVSIPTPGQPLLRVDGHLFTAEFTADNKTVLHTGEGPNKDFELPGSYPSFNNRWVCSTNGSQTGCVLVGREGIRQDFKVTSPANVDSRVPVFAFPTEDGVVTVFPLTGGGGHIHFDRFDPRAIDPDLDPDSFTETVPARADVEVGAGLLQSLGFLAGIPEGGQAARIPSSTNGLTWPELERAASEKADSLRVLPNKVLFRKADRPDYWLDAKTGLTYHLREPLAATQSDVVGTLAGERDATVPDFAEVGIVRVGDPADSSASAYLFAKPGRLIFHDGLFLVIDTPPGGKTSRLSLYGINDGKKAVTTIYRP